MAKYTVEVMLVNGENLSFTKIEAANEKEAIDNIANLKKDFVHFRTDSAYYRMNPKNIIGYKVMTDTEDDEPVKQALN